MLKDVADFAPRAGFEVLTSALPLLLTLAVSISGDGGATAAGTSACPRPCFCNAPSRIVYCSRRGLATIPAGVPSDTVQLNVNGNAFGRSTLERRNFTALARLEHVYMSECAIERILVDTFADLTALQWLDLSNNHIKVDL